MQALQKFWKSCISCNLITSATVANVGIQGYNKSYGIKLKYLIEENSKNDRMQYNKKVQNIIIIHRIGQCISIALHTKPNVCDVSTCLTTNTNICGALNTKFRPRIKLHHLQKLDMGQRTDKISGDLQLNNKW